MKPLHTRKIGHTGSGPGDDDLGHLLQKANYFQHDGQYQLAEQQYRSILKFYPQCVDAMYCLGILYHQTGCHKKAIASIQSAIKLKPDIPEYYCNLGAVYAAGKSWDLAEACYRQALSLNPDYGDAYNNLANVFRQKQDLQAAIECYQKALQLHPEDAIALNNLGIAYRLCGRFDAEIECYRKALRITPNDSKLWTNLGNALQKQEQLDHAVRCYTEALHLEPENHRAYNNLGSAYLTMGQLSAARVCFENVLQIKPDHVPACVNLGNIYHNQVEYDKARCHYEMALAIDPNDAAAAGNLIYTLQYRPDVDAACLYRAAAGRWHRCGVSHRPARRADSANGSDRRIRIGYVSPDFRTHSVSYFFLPLLEHHDRERFEIFCYAELSRPDQTTGRIRSLADRWRATIYRSTGDVVEQICDDRIDILVDLAGHTSGNRLDVFAAKPAPVQVTWLGYPGTTGLTAIDYRFTDEICDPPGESDKYHSERLIRLKNGLLCYQPPPTAPAIGPLPCQKSGHVTFGSFNNLPKITPRVVYLWACLLNNIPDSRLLIKSRQLNDKPTAEHIRRQFGMHGIADGRLDLLGRSATTAEHLDTYNRIDIALDPFPYNGTTTTCEALWMGTPVVTLLGLRHAARVGASLLQRIGRPELIARDEDEYVETGTKLAFDTERLEALHACLRKQVRASTLCDAVGFTKGIEEKYLQFLERRIIPGTRSPRTRFGKDTRSWVR